MRLFLTAFFVAFLCIATTSPTRADFARSKAWYDALPQDERYAVQSDLLLLGHYDALVDGKFGRRTYAGLLAFQRTSGTGEAGVLSPIALQSLHQRGAAAATQLGLSFQEDERAGVALPVAGALLSLVTPVDTGTRYASPTGSITLLTVREPTTSKRFADRFAKMVREPGRSTEYSRRWADGFIISGRSRDRFFYSLFWHASNETYGFTLTWDASVEREARILTPFITSYFMPLDHYRTTRAPAGPEEAPPPSLPTTVGMERLGSLGVFDDAPHLIALDGDISMRTPLEFLRALKARPDARVILLNSNGGLVNPALVIAHEVRERGLSTIVPKGSACLSACAFIFFAGVERAANGELGVHQVWNEVSDAEGAQTTLSDVLEALNAFQVEQEVVSRMLRTPPRDMHVFSDREIAELRINVGNPVKILGEAGATPKAPPTGRDKTHTAVQASNSPPELKPDERLPSGDANEPVPLALIPTPAPVSHERLLSDGATNAGATAADPADPTGGQSLLLEASDNGTTGALPFLGTVKWSKGIDETGSPTLIGQANIPARDLTVDVLIRRNTDVNLPAKHLIEVKFRVQDSFAGGSIAGLPGVLLKNEELVQGTPLVGASARVTENSFLFALSETPEDMTANNALLTSRKWMDLALIYATGKRAIITLELSEEVLKDAAAVMADNTSVAPKTRNADEAAFARSERIVFAAGEGLDALLLANGFGPTTLAMAEAAFARRLSLAPLPVGSAVRILLGPSRYSATLIPQRVSIYVPDPASGELRHHTTFALTDRGNYTLAVEPESKLYFTKEGIYWATSPDHGSSIAGKSSRARPSER